MPSNRKLMWIVRLVFYPVSIGLIVLAWQQREGNAPRANGDPLAGRMVARLAAPRVSMELAGRTSRGGVVRVVLRDGRPVAWSVKDVPLRCASRAGTPELRFTHRQGVHRPQDVVRNERLITRRVALNASWENSWTGRVRVRSEIRLVNGALVGRFWVVAKMNPPLAEPVCRSGASAFYLTRTNPPA